MAATKPKTNVKRKAPVRVSKKKRGISKIQALAVAGVLALIGVVAVVASHASGTPNYQYSSSKYCVADNGKSSAKAVQDCKNTSAEAMVYRLYKGLHGRKPDNGGYKYWVQQLAGDRTQPSKTSLVTDQVAKMGTDTAFVKNLYVNMLGRSGTVKEVNYWTAKLSNSKGWTRQQVAVNFATSSEAIRVNQTAFNTFLASAPKVAVVQAAAIAQRKRYEKMFNEYRQPAERNKEAAQAALNTAKAQLTAAGKTADKNPPSASDLKSIASNQTNASNAYSAALNQSNQAAAKATAAKGLYDESKQLADYATDIRDNSAYGMKQIGARYRATKGAATAAKSYAASAKARIKDIANKYAAAEKKYQEAQAAALATVNSTPASGACAPSECPPIKDKQGETIQQYETRVSNFCNSLADKSITLKGAFTGIAHATSVDAIFDITYIKNGTFKPNCDKKFKSYNYNSLKCASPWFPDGNTCNAPAATPATPAVPVSGQSTNVHRCPKGWIPNGTKYCYNGTVSREVNIDERCPRGTYAFGSRSTEGIIVIKCRTRMGQGKYTY